MFIVAVGWPDLSSGTRPGTVPKPPGLKLLASKSDVRAWPGGFGYAKVGANYGPAFVSHMEGRKMGYDQILWLLGADYQVCSILYLLLLQTNSSPSKVTEAGASNFFIVWKTKDGKLQLVTAPLEAKVILEGVTRGSVLELARQRLVSGSEYLTSHVKDLEVAERDFTMLEIEEAWKEGRIVEAFLSGTAVSPNVL